MNGQGAVMRLYVGTVLVYLVAVLAGVAIGYLYNQISRQVELAIVFPVLAGMLGGLAIRMAIWAGRSPRTKVVLVAGVLAGGLAFASSFYFDYQQFRGQFARTGIAGVTLSASQVDRAEQQLLGSTGLVSYMSARAQYGVTGRLLGGTPVHGDMEWLLWAGEIALAGCAGGAMAGMRRGGAMQMPKGAGTAVGAYQAS